MTGFFLIAGLIIFWLAAMILVGEINRRRQRSKGSTESSDFAFLKLDMGLPDEQPPEPRPLQKGRIASLILGSLAVLLIPIILVYWPKISALAIILVVAGMIYLEVEIRKKEPELSAVGVHGWTVLGFWIRFFATLITKGMATANAVEEEIPRTWKNRPGYKPPVLYEGARAGTRALDDQFGQWPKITHSGKGGFLIEAPHDTPRRFKWPNRLGVLTAFPGFVVAAFFVDNSNLGIAKAVVGGILIGWISAYAIWPQVCKKRLKISVEDGGARWTGPDGKPCRVWAFEDFSVEAMEHRLAKREAFDHIKIRQKDPSASPEPLYQLSSEVVVKTGERKHIEWAVADILNDEKGQKAGDISAAIVIAINRNRKAIEEIHTIEQSQISDDGRFE